MEPHCQLPQKQIRQQSLCLRLHQPQKRNGEISMTGPKTRRKQRQNIHSMLYTIYTHRKPRVLMQNIDGLVQERRNSIANALGLRLFCTKPSIWVRSRNCGCLVTWFCYQLIAKPGNKTATFPWPDPYVPTVDTVGCHNGASNTDWVGIIRTRKFSVQSQAKFNTK